MRPAHGGVVALALLLALTSGGCESGTIFVPVAPVPPPPSGPAEPPPVIEPPPPPEPPVPPPASVAELVERIRLGATLTEVSAVMGGPPIAMPTGGGPDTARWYVTEGETRYLVFVVFEAGRATRKGSARVEVFR